MCSVWIACEAVVKLRACLLARLRALSVLFAGVDDGSLLSVFQRPHSSMSRSLGECYWGNQAPVSVCVLERRRNRLVGMPAGLIHFWAEETKDQRCLLEKRKREMAFDSNPAAVVNNSCKATTF